MSVARLHNTIPTMLPPASASASVRRLTGTIAINGVSGSASCSARYPRRAPAHIASTTSLMVVPEAALTLRIRSSDHDCAATRRAPPIGTFNMVRGAPKGRVNCCSSNAARANASVDGASAATDPTVRVIICSRDGLSASAGLALGRQIPRNADRVVIRVGRQRALRQLQRRDPVDQRMVKLHVHGEPIVVQSLDQMGLPQRAVPIEQGAM